MNTLFSEKGTAVYLVRFTSKELDPLSGLYDFRTRYYDPRLSVWFGVDSRADKYPAWNPFNYTLNNPIKLIDLDGRGLGDPNGPYPTVAVMLYEEVGGASNAIYNTMAKVAEALGYGEPGINSRKEIQYDDNGNILGNEIVNKPEGTWGDAIKETALDALSISAITPGGKAITGSVLAAKVPVKTTMVSFIKKIGDTGEKITTHLPEGYQLTKLKSSGQKVYSNGKNWITPDITSHK